MNGIASVSEAFLGEPLTSSGFFAPRTAQPLGRIEIDFNTVERSIRPLARPKRTRSSSAPTVAPRTGTWSPRSSKPRSSPASSRAHISPTSSPGSSAQEEKHEIKAGRIPSA